MTTASEREATAGGALAGFVRGVGALWREAAMESHESLWAYCFPRAFNELSVDAKLASGWVRLNPAYWLGFVATAVLMFVGMSAHHLIGQGPADVDMSERGYREGDVDAVRVIEREVRCEWVYLSDGLYLLQATSGVVSLAGTCLPDGCGWSPSVVVALFDEVLTSLFIVMMNVFFLAAIIHRRAWMTRYFIFLNFVYATTETFDWTYSVFTVIAAGEGASNVGAIVGTFLTVFFYVLAAVLYARLWRAYSEDLSSAVLDAIAMPHSRHADRVATEHIGVARQRSRVGHAIEGILLRAELATADQLELSRCSRGHDGEGPGGPWPKCMIIAMATTCTIMWGLEALFVYLGWTYAYDIEHASEVR